MVPHGNTKPVVWISAVDFIRQAGSLAAKQKVGIPGVFNVRIKRLGVGGEHIDFGIWIFVQKILKNVVDSQIQEIPVKP